MLDTVFKVDILTKDEGGYNDQGGDNDTLVYYSRHSCNILAII